MEAVDPVITKGKTKETKEITKTSSKVECIAKK